MLQECKSDLGTSQALVGSFSPGLVPLLSPWAWSPQYEEKWDSTEKECIWQALQLGMETPGHRNGLVFLGSFLGPAFTS